MKFIYGFTGTRRGMTEEQKQGLREFVCVGEGEFHHGDCLGSDNEADIIARRYGYSIVIHPPKVAKYRAFCGLEDDEVRDPQDYLVRNRDIVQCCEFLIATPGEEREILRSGTWSTIRYARKVGRPLAIIYPDGNEQWEN